MSFLVLLFHGAKCKVKYQFCISWDNPFNINIGFLFDDINTITDDYKQ
jgi:hypothetical protein